MGASWLKAIYFSLASILDTAQGFVIFDALPQPIVACQNIDRQKAIFVFVGRRLPLESATSRSHCLLKDGHIGQKRVEGLAVGDMNERAFAYGARMLLKGRQELDGPKIHAGQFHVI